MTFRPSERLTEEQVNKGLKYVIGDGLATEAMVTLTSGAFLVAMALSMGATNFQIGLLAAFAFPRIFRVCMVVYAFNNASCTWYRLFYRWLSCRKSRT